MNDKFSLSINKPCSEKFSDFAPTDKGGYCSSCQKTVIDFTKMNDREILNYFNNQEKKTCGLFLETQLKSYSGNPLLNQPKSSRFATGVFGFSLFSLLSFNSGYSQEKAKANETVKIEKDTEELNTDSSEANQRYKIKGTVSDESGPMPGVNVILRGTQIGTSTEFDGTFTFPERLKIGDILVVSFMGYTDQQITVSQEDAKVKKNYEIILKSYPDNGFPMAIMGDVNTTTVYKSKRTFFQKVKSFFTND